MMEARKIKRAGLVNCYEKFIPEYVQQEDCITGDITGEKVI